MALPSWVTWFANIMGPPGPQGPTGTFADAHAIAVPFDTADLKPILSGPQSARVVTFKAPRGQPGQNGVENDSAVAQRLRAPDTETYQAAFRLQRRRVHIVPIIGQSIPSGRGTPYSAITDPEHPRILQRPFNSATLVPATPILSMKDTPSGISPGLEFARHLIASVGPDDVVVLVPCAQGGTALSSDATDAWRWGTPGGLSALAVSRWQSAIALAQQQFPNHEVITAAIIFGQGEADTPTAWQTYRADMLALINGMWSVAGYEVPFIIGAMVPEGVERTPGREAIDFVHKQLPYEKRNVGFADGTRRNTLDLLHYNADGVRALGRAYFDEWLRMLGGATRAQQPKLFPGRDIWRDYATGLDGNFSGQLPSNAYLGTGPYTASASITRGNGIFTANAPGAGNSVVAFAPSGESDGVMGATYRGGAATLEVVGRYISATDCLRARLTATALQLLIEKNDVITVLDSVAYTRQAGDVLNLVMRGPLVRASVNGGAAATATKFIQDFVDVKTHGFGAFGSSGTYVQIAQPGFAATSSPTEAERFAAFIANAA